MDEGALAMVLMELHSCFFFTPSPARINPSPARTNPFPPDNKLPNKEPPKVRNNIDKTLRFAL